MVLPMEKPTMKPVLALFLQAAVVLLGLAVLSFLLWEPHIEGRNAHATTFEIYFKDPFLAYVYVGSLWFFMALRRAFGLLGDVRRDGAFSPLTVEALRAIKRCVQVVIGFVGGAVVMILVFGDGEDRPAGIFMCLLATIAMGSVAGVAGFLARKLEQALG